MCVYVSVSVCEYVCECVCVCVCVCVTLHVQICKMQKILGKMYTVSAREISTFLCVEMAMSLKILGIESEREILAFLDIDYE